MTALARRVSHAVLFLAVVLGVATSPASAAAPAKRLNVVFFLADDLGWADTGCYGGDLHETPNIDRLAREGVRFTDAYAASPVCSPTRASIMTGKSPAKLHITIWREDALVPPRDRKLLPPVTVADLPHSEVRLRGLLHDWREAVHAQVPIANRSHEAPVRK